MTPLELEMLLARLYSDEALCRAVLADPVAAAREHRLSAAALEVIQELDRTGLELAARSFAAKRARR